MIKDLRTFLRSERAPLRLARMRCSSIAAQHGSTATGSRSPCVCKPRLPFPMPSRPPPSLWWGACGWVVRVWGEAPGCRTQPSRHKPVSASILLGWCRDMAASVYRDTTQPSIHVGRSYTWTAVRTKLDGSGNPQTESQGRLGAGRWQREGICNIRCRKSPPSASVLNPIP